jgi:hypothetical protein
MDYRPGRFRAFSLTLLVLLPLLAAGDDDRIDRKYYYRLTNAYLGESFALDTRPDGEHTPVMAESGDFSGQLWRLEQHDGCYRLTNMFLGKSKSLDTHSGGKNQLFMGDSGNYSGQCWSLTPEHDGYFRLTNLFLGTSHSLDNSPAEGHAPLMAESGNFSGQLWKLTRLGRVKE